MKVLGIAGSLRKGSYNRLLLRAARELAPVGVEIEIYEGLREIPPYDQDVDAAGAPEVVVALRRAIAEAEALLIATPEYNYSVPGVLKNAIDWASRPARGSVLNGKPAAIMGASTGMSGTIRAQLALRQSFLFTDTPTLLNPQVSVPFCADKFDGAGRLVDEMSRDMVRQLMAALPRWVERFR